MTGITNVGGYSPLVFSSGSQSLVISNNTGTPISAATDQDLSDSLVSILNSTFINGSQIQAGDLVTRVGLPTVNSSSSNLANIIGGSELNLASRLGDPVGGLQGLSGLIQASAVTNGNNIWSDLSSFQNATNLNDQLTQFLALLSTSQLTNPGATSITFTLTGTPPTSLADLISKATSIA